MSISMEIKGLSTRQTIIDWHEVKQKSNRSHFDAYYLVLTLPSAFISIKLLTSAVHESSLKLYS